MKLYHGSCVGALENLTPFVSEHGKAFVYFSANPVTALLYAVKPVPKPFSYYSYGFDENGVVVYCEYWKNAFYELYAGKSGFLYTCNCTLSKVQNPTGINGVYTAEKNMPVESVIEIPDIYQKFMKFESDGLFKIKPYDAVSKNELNFVYQDMKQTIIKNNLKSFPDSPMSIFIRQHFLNAWNDVDV